MSKQKISHAADLERAALECGAFKACVLPVSQIALDASFRDICAANQCGAYGRYWVCPPACGEIGPLMERVRACDYALLYQTVDPLEDSFDIEGMQRAKQGYARVGQRLLDAFPDAAMHLGAGGCSLCEHCTRPEGLPCRHPDRAMIPMEGCGIDVYNTTRETPLKYINGQNTVTYFGMVLFSEGEHAETDGAARRREVDTSL